MEFVHGEYALDKFLTDGQSTFEIQVDFPTIEDLKHKSRWIIIAPSRTHTRLFQIMHGL